MAKKSKSCAGCGARPPVGRQHPMVGISLETGKAVSSPVCHECWMDPAHRERTLKMHFFVREQEDLAVATADSVNSRPKGAAAGLGGGH